MRPASDPAPTTRQCFSLSRRNQFAKTSLFLTAGLQFLFGKNPITNRALCITFKHSRFDSALFELFVAILANRPTLGQFLDTAFADRHSANAPCIGGNRDCVCQWRVSEMILLEKFFHQFASRFGRA